MTIVRETIIKDNTRLLNRLVIGSVDFNRASILISRDRNNDPSLSDPSLAFPVRDHVATVSPPTIDRLVNFPRGGNGRADAAADANTRARARATAVKVRFHLAVLTGV